MFKRLAALLLGLMLVTASGHAQGILFLCQMDGQLRRECCCKKAGPAGQGLPALERDDSCCEVRASEVSNGSAVLRSEAVKHDAPVPFFWVPPSSPAPKPRASTIAALPVGARAPPRAVRLPLYLVTSRYLI